MQRVTFEPTNLEFANPERGFFTIYDPFFPDNSNRTFTAEDLEAWGARNAASLVSKRYAIDDFRTRDLSADFLGEVEADFETVREAGFKLIPRFTYVWNLGINDRDAPLDWTLRHIEQLAPIFAEHTEVLDHVSGGFIGRWGEMHSSAEGHVIPGTVSLSESGEEIVRALLDAVPDERMVALRYPQQIEAIASEAVGSDNAFGPSTAARTGFFNDGFLYDDTDFGTFDARPAERAAQERFIAQATEFVVTSGEPAGSDGTSYTFDADPVARLDAQNFASLSAEQTDAVASGIYADWAARGLYDDISRGLGYRFELSEARLPEDVTAGGTLDLWLTVENVGYARAHNERPLEVVLRGSDGTLHRLATGVDARNWGEGGPVRVDLTLDLRDDLAAGTYDVLLALPDPSPELASDPRYSIRLANEGVWEAETGLNALGAQVTVQVALPGTLHPAEIGASGTATFRQASPDAWTRVEFGAILEDAVVVLGSPTANGSQPTSLRVRNVDETGFEMQIDEWDYLDGRSARESVGWMALEAGTYRLKDGRRIDAGWTEAGASWTDVAFVAAFEDKPAVFTSVVSPDDAGALTARLTDVNADAFDFRLDGQERDGADPAGSRIGYFAVEMDVGTGIAVAQAGRIDHDGANVDLSGEFDEVPVLLAAMQTSRGRDPATLRLDALDEDRARLRVEEERSWDDEIWHRPEEVAYLATTMGSIEGYDLKA